MKFGLFSKTGLCLAERSTRHIHKFCIFAKLNFENSWKHPSEWDEKGFAYFRFFYLSQSSQVLKFLKDLRK